MKAKHLLVAQLDGRRQWRPDFRGGYASQWGFRPNSDVARLINHLRDEFRAFYNGDYALVRIGKNRWRAVEIGDHGPYWADYAVQEAPKFNLSVVR